MSEDTPGRIAPVGCLDADQVRSVLIAATAAPSPRNSQPWRFRCAPGAIELYADNDRAVPAAGPDHRELLLACGAALLNLRVAIRVLGGYPIVRLFPRHHDPTLLATVRVEGRRAVTPTDRALADAIPRRRTNLLPFHPIPVSLRARNELRRAAETERAWLAVVSPAHLPELRALVHRAHRIQRLPEPRDDWVLREVGAGAGASAGQPGHDVDPEPLVVVVGSFHDTPPAWLQAGQAMQRVLLTATVGGLSGSFLSQVVEAAETRAELRTLLGGGLWPQIVLRIGHCTPAPPTSRRPLADVLGEDLLANHRA